MIRLVLRSLTWNRALLLATTCGALCALPQVHAEPAPLVHSPEQADFFESKVRPLLVAQCQGCHGEKKQESEVRLDNSASVLQGNAKGPLVVPGDVAKSRLMHAVKYDGEIQMPPKGKMPDSDIAVLKQWIERGAYWPVTGPAVADPKAAIAEGAKKHWAFQPVKMPAVPPVKDTAWIKSPVDSFVLATLEANNLKPSPGVDRVTLIRRLNYDLIGLPPTPAEIDAFVADGDPKATEKLVDRLLASPQYGERWARFWLDLARYSDTKGYVFQEDLNFPWAYTYRDWVIRAMNEDLPYDKFLTKQIAADLVPGEQAKTTDLPAMGFLTLGRRFLNDQQLIIDDRIDVLCRTTQGLTVSCARCHDHKFDPIPTADYYSLYGVFGSSAEIVRLLEPATPQYKAELAKREQNTAKVIAAERNALLAKARSRAGEYLAAGQAAMAKLSLQNFVNAEELKDKLNPGFVYRWRDYLESTGKAHHPVLAPWHALAAIPAGDFPAKSAGLIAKWRTAPDPAKPMNRLVIAALDGPVPNNLAEIARRYGKLFAEVDRQWQDAQRDAAQHKQPPPSALLDRSIEEVRQLLYGNGTPLAVDPKASIALLDPSRRALVEAAQKSEADYRASDAQPTSTLAMGESPAGVFQPFVFLRGNAGMPGPAVPRQYLAIVDGPQRKPFTQGSGRLELAQRIASPTNPLTARVLVNRIWLQHFGAGFVNTPSDFGLRSDPPSNVELLDYLASRFMSDGWSLKKLHRLIVLSSTYQQASDDRPECHAADPNNRLVWRMNRRRLDWEMTRDGLLATAGVLDQKQFGKPVDMMTDLDSTRRTIYGRIDRGFLPGTFRVFDFASPDIHSPARHSTMVPQQALYFMNNEFVMKQAKRLLARPELRAGNDNERLLRLYRLVYGRAPNADEITLAMGFLRPAGGEASGEKEVNSRWENLAHALLQTNEFVFVD